MKYSFSANLLPSLRSTHVVSINLTRGCVGEVEGAMKAMFPEVKVQFINDMFGFIFFHRSCKFSVHIRKLLKVLAGKRLESTFFRSHVMISELVHFEKLRGSAINNIIWVGRRRGSEMADSNLTTTKNREVVTLFRFYHPSKNESKTLKISIDQPQIS